MSNSAPQTEKNVDKRPWSAATAVEVTPTSSPNSDRHLHGGRLIAVHGGLLMLTFLVALDQSIVSTAIPKLASEFHALDELTWIVAAYFLTQAGILLFFGRVLKIVSTKWVILFCIVEFEASSLLCALSPGMNVLIFARTAQGIGASGGFIAVLTIAAEISTLALRPILISTFAAMFGFAGVIGPIIGGLFTDHLTWRWCFYINLPLGAISFFVIVFLFPAHPPLGSEDEIDERTTLQKWLSLDWVGVLLSLAMVTFLVVPLQWGGVTKAWSDGIVIAFLVLSGVLFIAFGLWEYHRGDEALLPVHMLLNRTQLAAGVTVFFVMTTHISNVYHLPFLFQAKGRSASQSGIDIFPYVLGMIFASLSIGILAKRTGRYWYLLPLGPTLAAIGSGLLYTVTVQTESPKLIGFQLLLGLGVGCIFQIPLTAVQAEYADRPTMISQATSLQLFFQMLGGVCGISITGAILGNQLTSELATYASQIPDSIIQEVKQSVTVIFSLPAELQVPVIDAYVSALDRAFLYGVPAMAIALVSCVFIRNWDLHDRGRIAAEGGGGRPGHRKGLILQTTTHDEHLLRFRKMMDGNSMHDLYS